MDHGWATTSDRYLTAGAGDAWAAEAAASGRHGSSRILDITTAPAVADVATALHLADDDRVVIRRRLILADDQPVEIATSHYPATLAGHTPLADPAKIPGGAVNQLAKLGYTPAEVREELAARPATADERDLLHLTPGAAVLVLTRTSLTDGGEPYEYAVMVSTQTQRYVRRAA